MSYQIYCSPGCREIATKENDEQKEWDWKYYIAYFTEEDDDE